MSFIVKYVSNAKDNTIVNIYDSINENHNVINNLLFIFHIIKSHHINNIIGVNMVNNNIQ